MSQRHISRQIALQTMYELDVRGIMTIDREDLREVINRNIEEMSPDHKDNEYLYHLMEMIISRLNTLDDIIVKAAPEWPIDKISYIDRNILRIGLGELLFADRRDVPPKVAIDQAIELSKAFGAENSAKFINGVLGSIYKEMGEPDKDAVTKRRSEEESLTGVILYSRHNGNIYLGLVHDLFKHWTICKSHTIESETIDENVSRVVKKEFGVQNVRVISKIGDSQFIANHPDKGRTVKNVTYYLAESSYDTPKIEEGGGLTDARWWDINNLGDIKIYRDVNKVIVTAIAAIPSIDQNNTNQNNIN